MVIVDRHVVPGVVVQRSGTVSVVFRCVSAPPYATLMTVAVADPPAGVVVVIPGGVVGAPPNDAALPPTDPAVPPDDPAVPPDEPSPVGGLTAEPVTVTVCVVAP
jgi:hypothetical protein